MNIQYIDINNKNNSKSGEISLEHCSFKYLITLSNKHKTTAESIIAEQEVVSICEEIGNLLSQRVDIGSQISSLINESNQKCLQNKTSEFSFSIIAYKENSAWIINQGSNKIISVANAEETIFINFLTDISTISKERFPRDNILMPYTNFIGDIRDISIGIISIGMSGNIGKQSYSDLIEINALNNIDSIETINNFFEQIKNKKQIEDPISMIFIENNAKREIYSL
jgi:hypothetical protein